MWILCDALNIYMPELHNSKIANCGYNLLCVVYVYFRVLPYACIDVTMGLHESGTEQYDCCNKGWLVAMLGDWFLLTRTQ
jgi:hypothetical protein